MYKKDTFVDDTENNPEFINPMTFVGNIHNQALDALSLKSVTIDSICSFTCSFVENEFSQMSPFIPPINESISKSLSIAKRIGIECCHSYNTRGRSESETADSIYREIPEQWKPYINQISRLIESNESDSITIVRKFEEIDKTINDSQRLSNEDKNGLWACSSIALHSYIYNLSQISTRAVTAEGVVKADLAGAIGGFFCWKFWGKTASGLMFGPQGAVMAAAKEIVIGAIVGSGVHVISWGYL